MNPSIADETILDQTLKRCVGWAERQGYGGMEIVNVLPLVSTDPRGLNATAKVRSSLSLARSCNVDHIRNIAERTTLVLGCGDLLTQAWLRRIAAPALRDIVTALKDRLVFTLATTANGLPRHPLARGKAHIASEATYVPYDLEVLRRALDEAAERGERTTSRR